MGKQKKFAILSALVGLGILAAALFANREALRLEWVRRQAREDALREDGPPSEAWKAIFDARERGFRHLAKLLRDPDPRVWRRASARIDSSSSLKEFVPYLRDHDRLALLRYLLPDCYGDRSIWRGDAYSSIWWTAGDDGWAEPFEEGVDLLERIARGTLEGYEKAWAYDPDRLRTRAIRFLGSMLRPEEADSPGSSLAGRVVDVLGKVGVSDAPPAVRFVALYQLARSSVPVPGNPDPSTFNYGEDRYQEKLIYRDARDLSALAHLDHSSALRVMGRLRRSAELWPKLLEVLEARKPLGPVPMPEWLPFEKSVPRLLAGSRDERVDAAVFAAETGMVEMAPAIRAALAAETREEEKLLLETCLVALGNEALRAEVRKAFIASLSEGRLASILPSEHPPALVGELLLLSGDIEALGAALEDEFFLIRYEDFGLPRNLMTPDAGTRGMSIHHRSASWWWKDNRDRVAWDATRKKFVVRERNQNEE